MKASILLAAYENRRSYLEAVMAVCFQSIPREDYEIFVLDNGWLNREERFIIKELQKTCSNIRIISDKNARVPQLYNRAAKQARGENLLFLASHCIPPFDWVEQWLKRACKTKAPAIAGCIRSIPSANIIANLERKHNERVLPMIMQRNKGAFLDYHNALVKREAYLERGGIDEDLFYVFPTQTLAIAFHESGQDVAAAPDFAIPHYDQVDLSLYCRSAYHEGFDKGIIYMKFGFNYGLKYFPHPKFVSYFKLINIFHLPLRILFSIWYAFFFVLFKFANVLNILFMQEFALRKAALQSHRRGQLSGLSHFKKLLRKQ